MSQYFEEFPTLRYDGKDVRDITRRVGLIKKALNNPYVFLPYTVPEGMRPEDVAYHYYGSTEYTWLVYLANDIYDPYHQWPLSQENFEKYLIEKYAEQSGKTGYEVIDWLRDETNEDNILYYYREYYAGQSDTTTLIQSVSQDEELVVVRVTVAAEERLATGDVELLINNAVVDTRTLSNGAATFYLEISDLSSYDIMRFTAKYLGSTTHLATPSINFITCKLDDLNNLVCTDFGDF